MGPHTTKSFAHVLEDQKQAPRDMLNFVLSKEKGFGEFPDLCQIMKAANLDEYKRGLPYPIRTRLVRRFSPFMFAKQWPGLRRHELYFWYHPDPARKMIVVTTENPDFPWTDYAHQVHQTISVELAVSDLDRRS